MRGERQTSRRRKLKLYRLGIAAVIGFVIGSAVITENGFHNDRRPVPDNLLAEATAHHERASWEPARITSHDGVPLQGWLFTPPNSNGGAAIVLHGVGDTRQGMLEHAQLLLQAGYTVLAPDFRGHGTSGGSLITYGVRESADIHDWSDWLLAHRPVTRLYGLGRSMGAAILIESLRVEPRFRAVVAECPFYTFEDIAYYRLGRASHLGRAPLWPMVRFGFLYAQVRYGVDLDRASPADSVRATHTPVLLIHGTSDTNIPPSHSERLHALNPAATTLWLVPGAEHLNAMNVDRERYVKTVLGWFEEH